MLIAAINIDLSLEYIHLFPSQEERPPKEKGTPEKINVWVSRSISHHIHFFGHSSNKA